jgi:hypothetical protein
MINATDSQLGFEGTVDLPQSSVTYFPNGPECGPECHNSQVTVTLEK